MFCKKCGAQLANDAEFCTECGSKVEEVQTFSQSVEVAQKSNAKAIVGALLTIAGGASIIYAITEFNQGVYYSTYHYNMSSVISSHETMGTVFVVIGSIAALIGIIMLIAGFKKKK